MNSQLGATMGILALKWWLQHGKAKDGVKFFKSPYFRSADSLAGHQ